MYMYITSSSILSVKEILVIGSLKMLMPELFDCVTELVWLF